MTEDSPTRSTGTYYKSYVAKLEAVVEAARVMTADPRNGTFRQGSTVYWPEGHGALKDALAALDNVEAV